VTSSMSAQPVRADAREEPVNTFANIRRCPA
jgi:hypothetical protein